MKRLLGIIICGLLMVTCGYKTLTAPDGGEVRLVSPLGYHVEATQEYLDAGGTVTALHGELADRWWTELMTDLQDAGYPASKTNAKKHVEWVFIYLYKPLDADSSIQCPGSTVLVGGCYDQFKPAFRAPGDYIKGPMLGRRPASQALKHEMLHHWCVREFGHLCQMPGESEWEGHHWLAPNGTDIWLFTWK